MYGTLLRVNCQGANSRNCGDELRESWGEKGDACRPRVTVGQSKKLIQILSTMELKNQSIFVVLFWWLLGTFYLLSLVLNASKFGGQFQVTSKVLIGTAMIYLLWAIAHLALMRLHRRTVGQYKLIGQILIFTMAAIFWIPLSLWFDPLIGDWIGNRELRDVKTIFADTNFFSLFFVIVLFLMMFFASLGSAYIAHWRTQREQASYFEKQHIQTQLDLSNMQMKLLKSQLSPHFLFNALGSISGLARSAQRDQIITAIRQLGDMLRFAISTSEETLIPIADEIEFTENYLLLQRLRFGDRFNFELLDDTVDQNFLCPPFLLQTLVENAFRHGVEQSEEAISIDASIVGGASELRIEVANDLPASRDNKSSLGVSLDNLRHRLELLYPGQAKVESKEAHGRFVATIAVRETVEHRQ